MPVLDTDLIWDDRLDLFGEGAATILADAAHDTPCEQKAHRDISQNLAALTAELDERLLSDRFVAPVLTDPKATFRDVA